MRWTSPPAVAMLPTLLLPYVPRMWATDITQEMLDMVKGEAAKRGLANIRTAYAKAEALPFEDESFDLVTCRIAPHHFDSIPNSSPRCTSRSEARRSVRIGRQRRSARKRRRLRERV